MISKDPNNMRPFITAPCDKFFCDIFFRVSNTRKDTPVKFNLLNHTKPDSLFNFGMKVLVYSEKLNKEEGTGWHRDGREIAYFQNSFKKVL